MRKLDSSVSSVQQMKRRILTALSEEASSSAAKAFCSESPMEMM